MKKILYLLSIVVLLFSISCENQEVEFDDFAYQSVYFPYQTPLRSLMLGDEVIGDNTIDLEHAFSIGVSVGGMYKNTKDREVLVELAPELASNITDEDGNALELLPADYYDATFDRIIIPAGQFFGKTRVNLKDAFFNDPLTIGLHYVIPVRITGTPGDTVLQGSPLSGIESPDPRVAGDWAVPPKNYVLFGIKYINSTHGVYLLRGKRTNTQDPQDVYAYSARFLDDNDITMLRTNSLTESIMTTVGGTNKEDANAKYRMLLTFDEANKSVSVKQQDESTVVVNGNGKYYSKEDAQAEGYNGKKHRTIYLDYTYVENGNTYQVNDSLVFVDTDMKFEEFTVNVVNP